MSSVQTQQKQAQRYSGPTAAIMRVLLRKRIICSLLLLCCLGVLAWLTYEQGRADRDSAETRQRLLNVPPDVDPRGQHHSGEVIVKQEESWEPQDGLLRQRQGPQAGGDPVAKRKKADFRDHIEHDHHGNGEGKKKKKKMPVKKKKGEERQRKMGKAAGEEWDAGDLGMTQQEAERWIQEKIKQEYCNPPDKRISGEEGKFRPGYELKAVYVVARHGDRTPMTEFVNIPNSTWHPQWNCDLREMSNTMWKSTMLRDFIQVMEEELESRRGDMAGVSPNFRTLPIGRSGRCSKSQLTPVGWLQHMRLGKFLRGAYGRTLVSQVELLTNVSTFRSTVNSRTQQSALAFMFGFLKTIGLRDTARIKSVPNVNFCPLDMCACPALERLVKAKEAQHSKIMRGNAGFMRAMHSIAETLYGSSKTALLPGINAVAEILATLVCHEKPYPCGSGGCVTSIQHAAYAKHIDEVLVAQSQVVDGMYEKLGRMFSEPFLTEMTKAMYRVSRGQSKPLFVFNSGHDITIRPLMDALGLAGPGWPSYAGRVVFEMWEQPSFKEHVVRVLAYGHDQTERVRFCRDKLDEDGLCPLDALLKFVETENMEHFYASSFQEACRQHPSTK